MQQQAVFGNVFPDPRTAAVSPEGVIAVGGLVDGRVPPHVLLEAYSKAIFPWGTYRGNPVWYCPNPRAGIDPLTFKVSKSFSKVLRNKEYRVLLNNNFKEVLKNCAQIERKQGTGTWLSESLQESVNELHNQGFAQSVEVYVEGALVGGLYGIKIGQMFFGESMFSKMADASKIALAHLCLYHKELGVEFIDCQMLTPHLESMGAKEYGRLSFLTRAFNLMGMPNNSFAKDFCFTKESLSDRIKLLL